jgi:hypothetical protein
MTQVSIIVPVYNREDLLPETLDSVRAQTFTDWECVIVDDGSTDESFAVAERYAAEDPRFRALRREGEPKGANRCRNQGFAASTGEYVIFLDSDDLLAPWCLERRVQTMQAMGSLDAVIYVTEIFASVPGDCDYCWNVPTDEPELDRILRQNTPWATLGPLWSRVTLARVGPWDETLCCSQDFEFHVRALMKGLTYRFIDEVDTFWRKSDGVRDSIGTRGQTPDNLHDQRRALDIVLGHIRCSDHFDRSLEPLLATRYWLIAERQAFAIGYMEAARTWSYGCRQLKIGLTTRAIGLVLLTALASPVGPRIPVRKLARAFRYRLPGNRTPQPNLSASLRRPQIAASSCATASAIAKFMLQGSIENLNHKCE